MNPFKTQPHICGGAGTVRFLDRPAETDKEGKVTKLLPIRRPFPRDPKRSLRDHNKAFVKALHESRADLKAPRRLKATYPMQEATRCWCVDAAIARDERRARAEHVRRRRP